MKRARRLLSEEITNQCVKWYRRHGNDCAFSVWKLISLVKGYHGLVKIDKSEIELAKHYGSKIPHDLSVMDGMKNND